MYRTSKQSPERNGHADRHCPTRAKRAGAQLAFMVAGAAWAVGLASSAQAQFTSWHAVFVSDDEGREDAEAMERQFRNWTWEFQGQQWSWDTMRYPANQIAEALAWLEARSVAGEITLAYYAGHAFWDTGPSIRAEESQTEDPGAPGVDETNEGIQTGPGSGYYDDDFGEQFREWDKEGYGIAIFDCCSAGGMVDGRSDINGKTALGENKKQETVLMACTEHELAVKRNDDRGVFTEFLLQNVPATGTPTVDTFLNWMGNAARDYLTAYNANPGAFNNQFQHFKQTHYADGNRQVTYFPEPTSLALLAAAGLLLPRRRVG